VSKADQIYDKVRLLPDSAQSAVLTLVESLVDETSIRNTAKHEPSGLARRFHELAEAWRRDTSFLSFTQQRAIHPAYQRIIGMGWAAVPLILRQLERRPDHWLWALESITGEAPARGAESFQAAVQAWLQWGRERGLLRDAA
jgi:hypothetical protein